MSHFTKQAENEAIQTEAGNLYTVFSIADQLSQEIKQEKAQKIKRLQEEYDLGLEPDSLEIARAIGKYLKKIS